MSAFDEAVKHENLPAVSFLKAPEYQDGHPGYSDPLDEQAFIAEKLDELEHSNQWESTAVVIAYDDSDGWYDHVMPPIVTPSKSASDVLNGAGRLRQRRRTKAPPADRCGYGPRLPLMVISPYAKQNYVDNTPDRPVLDPQVHRGKLAAGQDRRTRSDPEHQLGRLPRGLVEQHVRLRAGAPHGPESVPRPLTGEVTGEEGGEAGSEKKTAPKADRARRRFGR